MYRSRVFEIPGGGGWRSHTVHSRGVAGSWLLVPLPQHLPHTSTFLLDLNSPITYVSQYEKMLNSESTGKGRIHIITTPQV